MRICRAGISRVMPFRAHMVRPMPALRRSEDAARTAATWLQHCSGSMPQRQSARAGVTFSTIPGGPDAPPEWCVTLLASRFMPVPIASQLEDAVWNDVLQTTPSRGAATPVTAASLACPAAGDVRGTEAVLLRWCCLTAPLELRQVRHVVAFEIPALLRRQPPSDRPSGPISSPPEFTTPSEPMIEPGRRQPEVVPPGRIAPPERPQPEPSRPAPPARWDKLPHVEMLRGQTPRRAGKPTRARPLWGVGPAVALDPFSISCVNAIGFVVQANEHGRC